MPTQSGDWFSRWLLVTARTQGKRVYELLGVAHRQ
jgi:hypothetical protein